MTSAPHAPPAHPIAGLPCRLHAVLDSLTEVPTWSMTCAEQRETLIELARAQARMEELRLRVLAQAERSDVAADTAATSTSAWLAGATRAPRGLAFRDVQLATALDGDYLATRAALAAGQVDADQARVTVDAVQALARSAADAVAADPTVMSRAEQHLITAARDHDARELKVLGRRVLEVLDPGGADALLGAKLEAEERAAARATFLEMHHNPDGTVTGRFKVSTLHAAMLDTAIGAFTNPRHQRATGAPADPGRPRPELLGAGLCELLERLDPHALPKRSGRNATVVVLMDLELLLSGVGTAMLDTGQKVSAATARRLFCESGVVPAVYRRVLGGPSEILDLGRTQRFHSPAQRLALTIRDRTCTTEGCERPAGLCQAHHDIPWSVGGPTDFEHARLLCPFHHGKAHSPAYDLHRMPDGRVRFHKRL